MSFEVDGKVALVTGAAEGIGWSFVRNLLEYGAKGVAIADVNEVTGKEVTEQFNKKFGNKVIFIKSNVAVKENLENAFQKTCDHFKHLDIVINNAGILDEDNWELMAAVNFNAVIRSTTLAVENYLYKYKSTVEAVVVNVSSTSALRPFGCMPVYTATKSGVLALGRAYGHEGIYRKFGVRVITVCPGLTTTRIVTEGKYRYKEFFEDEVKDIGKQTAEVVGESLVEVVGMGKNGSVWLVDAGDVNELRFPEVEELLKSAV